MRKKSKQRMVLPLIMLCLSLGPAMGNAKEEWASAALEQAILQLGAAESFAIESQIAIRQNGEDKITGEALFQSKGENGYVSLAIASVDGGVREVEMSTSDENCVLRTGRDFYEMPVENGEPSLGVADAIEQIDVPRLLTAMEKLLGKASENMRVSDAGFSFHLEEDEVPFRLDFALSFVDDFTLGHITIGPLNPAFPSDAAVRYGVKDGTPGTETIYEMDITLPMGRDLHIRRILLDMPLEDGTIGNVHCTLVLAGQNAEHTVLETELSADIRVIGVNATEPAVVDTTGVEMKPLVPFSDDE